MIEYRNVSLCCKTNGNILNNLNFKINKGELFVLIGPSGSGKTTTLKLINRLIEQTDGDIYFNGIKLKEYNLRELRLGIGYVLQEIALFPNLTVFENISIIPEMKNMNKKEIKDKSKFLLQKVGLNPEEYMDRYPRELSGGERQRISILRAIIANPKVLLMDEPFSALDPISRVQLQDLIKNIHKEFGITIVFVTHDIQEAIKLGDRICIMKNGEIVQIDKPEEIIKNPINDFVKEFINTKVVEK